MIYLKRLWNLIAIFFVAFVLILLAPALIVEVFVIVPMLFIFKNENYTDKNEPLPFRVMWWMKSKLMFNTNKEKRI